MIIIGLYLKTTSGVDSISDTERIQSLDSRILNISGYTGGVGVINSYMDNTHAVGITASTINDVSSPVIVYDGNELHVPRALEDNSNGVYRIRDFGAILSGTTWYLRVRFIHPTGVQERYLPMISSI